MGQSSTKDVRRGANSTTYSSDPGLHGSRYKPSAPPLSAINSPLYRNTSYPNHQGMTYQDVSTPKPPSAQNNYGQPQSSCHSSSIYPSVSSVRKEEVQNVCSSYSASSTQTSSVSANNSSKPQTSAAATSSFVYPDLRVSLEMEDVNKPVKGVNSVVSGNRPSSTITQLGAANPTPVMIKQPVTTHSSTVNSVASGNRSSIKPVAEQRASNPTPLTKPSATAQSFAVNSVASGNRSSIKTVTEQRVGNSIPLMKPSSTAQSSTVSTSASTSHVFRPPLHPTPVVNKTVPSAGASTTTQIFIPPLLQTPLVNKTVPGKAGAYRKEDTNSGAGQVDTTDQRHGNKAILKKRNDCKFYYYSNCSRGERCDFRHEPAALQSKMVCALWQQGKCHRKHCSQRHMNLQNNKTPCYWKNMPGGCQIEDCPFVHSDAQENPKDAATKNMRPNKRYNRSRNLKRDQLGSTSDVSTFDDIEEKSEVGSVSDPTDRDFKFPNKNSRRKNADCKFYFFAVCSKGDHCHYRHEPSALLNKQVCYNWMEGKCHRDHCKYRHMILKNNPEACWWEINSNFGCLIKDCPFQHKLKEGETITSPPTSVDGNADNEDEVSETRQKRNRNRRARGRNENFRSHSKSEKDGERNEQTSRESECQPLNDKSSAASDILPKPTAPLSVEEQEAISVKILGMLQKKLQETEKKYAEERAQAVENVRKQEEDKLTEMKKLLEKTMEDGFTCTICFELFIKAVTLNCSHSFCQNCIRDWRKHERCCPLCRKDITSEIRALNIDNYIVEMIPNLSDETKRRREEIVRAREMLNRW